MDESGLGLIPLAGCGISGVESLGSINGNLINLEEEKADTCVQLLFKIHSLDIS
jgi:hypothetical protein